MNMLHISRLVFLGPSRAPAAIDFSEKITTICGASDTGKSFIVDAIDFLLGDSAGLRDIPQRVGYDRARLTLQLSKTKFATLERSIEGNGFRLVGGRIPDDQQFLGATVLKEQHRHDRVDNLSGWLLSHIGLNGRRIRRNKDGATNSLSFRGLANLVLINEADIIKQRSPFLTGQYVTATSEYATLKLLLTGVDDSAVVDTRVTMVEGQSASVKLEFVQSLVHELEAEVADLGSDEEELLDQSSKLDATIDNVQKELERAQSSSHEAMGRRRSQITEQLRIQRRLDEITDLLNRFELLAEHYSSDLLRLDAIKESGTRFVYLSSGVCPLCGTPPLEQVHSVDCDGDVASIVKSAESESNKIHSLMDDLRKARADLIQESDTLSKSVVSLQAGIEYLNNEIALLVSPALNQSQVSFRELAEKRTAVERSLELYRRLSRLRIQLEELREDDAPSKEISNALVDLSKSILDDFAATVERILKAWHFPSPDRVYFDEKTRDFVIGSKPRASYGKGFRAITHAAATIGLMEYCLSRDLPHPGFVILDSPLLAYWGPEGADDSLAGTDLKERFYDYISARKFKGQVIVVENDHPPGSVAEKLSIIVFTRNPTEGRFGLFPGK
jgi:hypothetical protein